MFQIALIFELKEEVTPELFAEKVAFGCAKSGVLRHTESIKAGRFTFTYVEDRDVDVLGTEGGGHTIHMPIVQKGVYQ